MKKIYILLLALSIYTFGFGQTIVTIDRDNVTGTTSSDDISSISSTGLTRGPGVNKSTTNINFTARNWTIGGDQATAEAADDYIEWSISANTSFDVAVDELDIRLRRNNDGPSTWQLFYSLDNFATSGISINAPQAIAALSTVSYNLPSLGINSGTSGTITFRMYAWGSNTNGGYIRVIGQPDWAGSLDITNPGVRITGSVTAMTPNSIESDIISTSTLFPPSENIDYTTYSATSGLTFVNSVPLGEFLIRDGGATAPDADSDGTTLTNIEFAIANSENIASLAIFDGFTNIAEVTSVGPLTTFSGLSLTANDDATKLFLVFATFKSEVTDNEQIELTVNSTSTPASGSSLFIDSEAGGASTPTTDDINRIEVNVSQFQFDQQPTDDNQSEIMAPYPTILAVDSNLNQDLDANIAGINVTTLPSSSIVTETYDMVNGEAILDNVVFTDTETDISLVPSGSGFSGTSTTFNIGGLITVIAEQNFDTATDWSYSSDTDFFGTVPDWGTTTGYFGEIALVDAPPLDNSLFSNEILGENDLNDTGNPFATVTFVDIDVSSLNNVRIEFDWQVANYVNNDNDIRYLLVIDGSGVGSWTDVFNGNGSVNDDQGRVKIDIPDGTSTVGINIRIRNNLTNGYSGFDNFRIISGFEGLTYTAMDGWKDNIEPDETTGALDAIVIDGTYNVSGDVQIDNLIINSGATAVIGFGQSITTNSDLINDGTLELNSISNNYSSLIVNGNVENEVTYNRHVNQFASTGSSSGANDLISAPVTNASQTFLALRTANPDIPSGTIGGVPSFLFGPFDNDTNAYINYTASDDSSLISSGIGYRTASDTPTGSTFAFVGDVETGTKLVPITTGTSSDFNLIGNPYPSYITLSGFLASNEDEFGSLTSGVYGYSGDFTDGFTVWNQAYSDFNPTALIAPGQGFLVSSSGSGTITFLPTMRSSGTSDDFILGRNGELNLAHLKLQLTSGTSLYNTDIYFNDNASLGMDSGYDSAMFENNTPNFAIYSHLVENNSDNDMAVQSVSYSDLNNVTIPLGINIVQGEQATVSILESNIPEDVTVILEDNFTNNFTDLQTGGYTFTPTTTLTETGRFYIHMSRESLGTTENILNGIEIYTNITPKEIVVKGQLETNTNLYLYDIQGRLVYTTKLSSLKTKHSVDVSNLTSGIYIVQLQNVSGNNRTQKVILK